MQNDIKIGLLMEIQTRSEFMCAGVQDPLKGAFLFNVINRIVI